MNLPYNWKRNFEEQVDKPVDKLVDKLSETEKRILKALKKHPDFSQPKIAELTGVGKTTVQTAIAKFKESGFAVRVGSNKDGHWEILKKTISVAIGTMRPDVFFQNFVFASYEVLTICLRTNRE